MGVFNPYRTLAILLFLGGLAYLIWWFTWPEQHRRVIRIATEYWRSNWQQITLTVAVAVIFIAVPRQYALWLLIAIMLTWVFWAWWRANHIAVPCPFSPCNRFGQGMNEVGYSQSETMCHVVYQCACCGNKARSSWEHGRALS